MKRIEEGRFPLRIDRWFSKDARERSCSGSRLLAIPKSSRGNTILGTGYSVYKKKSPMVSDTQGNKSFLAARMRKTSLSLLSERCAGFASVHGARDTCHTRTVSVCRHSCRAGISRRRNIDLRYTTKRASISVGNEAPRLRLFVTFFVTFILFSTPKTSFSTRRAWPKNSSKLYSRVSVPKYFVFQASSNF